MAALESKLKQRIVGALVLIALAVIFLPMLFKQEDTVREVVVQAPPMPRVPEQPQYPVADVTVTVPEPVVEDEWEQPIITEPVVSTGNKPTQAAIDSPASSAIVAPQPVVVTPAASQPISKTPEPKTVAPGIDKNNLPVSWSVQLANMASQANAEALRDTYRKKQYNAYVRSADGTHRVLIGPLVKQADAQAMCKSLKAREKQECFVVRYQP